MFICIGICNINCSKPSVCMLSCSVMYNLCDPRDYSLPGSSVMASSRKEYWSALLFLFPGDLPHPGIKPISHVSCIGRWILHPWATWEALLKLKADTKKIFLCKLLKLGGYFKAFCPYCSVQHRFKEILTDVPCEDINFRSTDILISL